MAPKSVLEFLIQASQLLAEAAEMLGPSHKLKASDRQSASFYSEDEMTRLTTLKSILKRTLGGNPIFHKSVDGDIIGVSLTRTSQAYSMNRTPPNKIELDLFVDPENELRLNIGWIAVPEALRGVGLGTALVDTVRVAAKQSGFIDGVSLTAENPGFWSAYLGRKVKPDERVILTAKSL